MAAVVYLLLSALLGSINAQLMSPCPRLFSYEPQKEPDRWYGVVTLISESDLSGVWLRLIFDRPSLQLGNWFGEIKTTDNKEYLIKNRNHALKANMPYALRFYIKFNPGSPPPLLMAIRLNAKTVCPEGDSTTPPAITGGELLQTSNQLEATTPAPPPPLLQPTSQSIGQTFVRPGGGWNPPSTSDDDDVFLGDFQLINRPHLKPTIEEECGTVVSPSRRRRRRKRESNFYGRFHEQHPNVQAYFFNSQGRRFAPNDILYRFLLAVLGDSRRARDETTLSPRINSTPTQQPNVTQTEHTVPQFNQNGIASLEAQPKPLITYGQSTSEGEFPWHAALYHERGADLQYICGASLINHHYVITVAHCVTRRRAQTTLNPDSLIVYLGKYYLKKWSNPGIQDSQVMMIHAHPEYNSQTYANDIALIKLLNPVTYTDFVRPICLWSEDIDLKNVMHKPGTVVGWGFDHTGKVTEELTQAKMPVVTKETCIYSFPDFFSRFTTSKTFCAGFRNGTSVCNGDSGGGMVFPKQTSTPNRKVWQLRGLVSISVALQNQFRCDSSHYVVFTDIAKYLDWIKGVTG